MAENSMIKTEGNQIKSKETSTVGAIKAMLNQDIYKKKFAEVLGQKAPQFTASLTTLVSSTDALKECDPASIMAAAYVAASFDLPIDSNLGFSALVPYNKKYKDKNGKVQWMKAAQFQMMYKGYIQLAIRSGQYKRMHCSEVYEDELEKYNPVTGECKFIEDFSLTTQRLAGDKDKIIGYYATFELVSGYKQELFMRVDEVKNHAKTYSQSYRYDLEKGKKSSRWSTDFDVMAKKTVIKLLLSKWGILSIEMQRAINDDQKVFDENGNEDYSDNTPDVVEAKDPFESDIEIKEVEEYEELDITE